MPAEIAPAALALIVQIDRQRQNQHQHDLARVRPARPVQHQRREHKGDRRKQRRPGTRNGRCRWGAVRRSTMTLIGTTR